jgi:NAD-dependent dihydropyrimidine dehydrogenase PreA subunit
MLIDQDTCTACMECVPYCPLGCIQENNGVVNIDLDECVECGVCRRSGICPNDSLYMQPYSVGDNRWLRAAFSDPSVQFPKQQQGGRGTEEMKTNDVTGKITREEIGMTLEFGRPHTGTRIKEIEKVTKAICPLGVTIGKGNPVTSLIKDMHTGTLKEDVKEEKVLSCILEFTFSAGRLHEMLEVVNRVLHEVNTLVSWGVITRFDADGSLSLREQLRELGFEPRPNAKINIGLGRPLID